VREFGVLAGIDVEAIASTKQNDFIGDRNAGNSGYVGESEVHRNAADDGRIVLANDHAAAIGQTAIQAICVADGQHCNSRRSFGDVDAAVTERLTGAHIPNGKNARFPGEHWLNSKAKAFAADSTPGTLEGKVISVQRQTGTDHGIPALVM